MWFFLIFQSLFLKLTTEFSTRMKMSPKIPELKKNKQKTPKQNHKKPHTLTQVRSIQNSVTAIYLKEYEENNLRYFQCNLNHIPTIPPHIKNSNIFLLDIIFIKIYKLYLYTMMVDFPQTDF